MRTIERIKLISDNSCRESASPEDEEVIQNLCITRTGEAFLNFYNYKGRHLRRKKWNLDREQIGSLLDEIAECVVSIKGLIPLRHLTTCMHMNAYRAYGDVFPKSEPKNWAIRIDDVDGIAIGFKGVLYEQNEKLDKFTESLRQILDEPTLYAFSGENESVGTDEETRDELPDTERFCYLLRQFRLANKKYNTQEKLAQATNIPKSDISKFERGISYPTNEQLSALCNVLQAGRLIIVLFNEETFLRKHGKL